VSPLRLAVLLVVVAVMVGLAALLARRDAATSAPAPAVLLAGFDAAAVTSLRITGAAHRPIATLERTPAGWALAERSGCPADAARVERLLETLAALHPVERKTADPARHATLGVEDPRDPAARGLRLDIVSGTTTRSLVIGRRATTLGHYVRLAGDPRTYAALPEIDLPRETALWLDRTLFRIRGAEVATIEVKPATGQAYRLRRDTPHHAHLRLEPVPRGRAVYDESIADPQAALLEQFVIDDVGVATDDWSDAAEARYTTFDGLLVQLAARRAGEHCRLRVQAAGNGGANAATVARARDINARASGREFEVAGWRCDDLFKPQERFLK
jgi:hypothetical protein